MPPLIQTRMSDLSSNSSRSKQNFTPDQWTSMSLMDIRTNTYEDKRIQSILAAIPSQAVCGSRYQEESKSRAAGLHTTPFTDSESLPTQTRLERSNEAAVKEKIVLPPVPFFPREPDIGTGHENSNFRTEKSVPNSKELSRLAEQRITTRIHVASVCHKCGQLESARRLYEEVLSALPSALIPEDRRKYIIVGCRIAEINLQAGYFEKAEETFKKLEDDSMQLEQRRPNVLSLEISQWLGITLDKRGDFESAYQKLKDVSKIAQEGIQPPQLNRVEMERRLEQIIMLTTSTLGLVLAHRGKFAQAKATSKEAATFAKQSQKTAKGLPVRDTRMDLNNAAIFAYSGDYAQASQIGEAVCKELELNYGPNNLATLESWGLQTQLLAITCKMEEAQERAEETLKGMRKELGKEHPLTLKLLETLALIYLSQGRITDAMDTAQHVRQANEKSSALGRLHPQTVSSINTLAMVSKAAGLLSKAEALQLDAVRHSKAHLGDLHPRTLRFETDLASIYCDIGHWEYAENILRPVLRNQWRYFLNHPWYAERNPSNAEIWERLKELEVDGHSLGNAHPSLFSTMHFLGVSQRELENGDLNLSKALLELSIEWRTKIFGPSHAETLSSMSELAKTERECGNDEDLESALTRLETILALRIQHLGEIHPDTLSARHDICVTKLAIGDNHQITAESTLILKLRDRILGSNHPQTIESQILLARARQSLGNLEEAETLFRSALRAQVLHSGLLEMIPTLPSLIEGERAYAKFLDRFIGKQRSNSNVSKLDRPLRYESRVVATIADLASCLVDQGSGHKLLLAADYQSDVVSLQRIWLGQDDLRTLQSENCLALIFQAQGQSSNAVGLYRKVLKNTPETHPLHLACQSNLASLYFEQGNFEEAESIQDTVVKKLQQNVSQDVTVLVESTFNLALTKMELAKKSGTGFEEALSLMTEVKDLSEELGHNHTLHIAMFATWQEWKGEESSIRLSSSGIFLE